MEITIIVNFKIGHKIDDEYVVVNHEKKKNNENSENDNDSSNYGNEDENVSKQIIMSILTDMINKVVLQHNNENKNVDRNDGHVFLF